MQAGGVRFGRCVRAFREFKTDLLTPQGQFALLLGSELFPEVVDIRSEFLLDSGFELRQVEICKKADSFINETAMPAEDRLLHQSSQDAELLLPVLIQAIYSRDELEGSLPSESLSLRFFLY